MAGLVLIAPRPTRRRRAPRELVWAWPDGVPLTPRRALPDVLQIVAWAWRLPLAASLVAALAGLVPWSAPASFVACALLVAVEETAHLTTAARASPGAAFALVTQPRLRAVSRVRPPLAPADAAAVALAGPLAACATGLVVITLPVVLWRLLPTGSRHGTLPWLPALVPPLWGLLAALPLPGSDAAIIRAARARVPLSLRLLLARCTRLLADAARNAGRGTIIAMARRSAASARGRVGSASDPHGRCR